MQASADLGNVDVTVNGKPIAKNLSWRQTFPMPTTTYSSVPAGTLHYQEFATGTTSPALVDTQLTVSSKTYYTIVTAGEESSASVGTILLTDDHVAPAAGQLRLRFVNAASTLGSVDLYFASGSNAGFPTSPSVPGLAFKSATSYFSFSGTTVQLCVNATGVASTTPGGLLPGVGSSCLTSITVQFQSPPQSSLTFFLLDPPPIPPSSSTGSFSAGITMATLPF